MGRRLIVFLVALSVSAMVFSAVNMTTVSAAELSPAKLAFNGFTAGEALPTDNTANHATDDNQYLGGFYTVYNNNTKGTAIIRKDSTDGNNYLEFRNKSTNTYVALRTYTGATIAAGTKIHIKIVIRPTAEYHLNNNDSAGKNRLFVIRMGSTKNDINLSKYLDKNSFDGTTWQTLEFDYTPKDLCDYINFYNYGKEGHGFDLKSFEISLIEDAAAPKFEKTGYDFDASENQDLTVNVDLTKVDFLEGVLLDRQDGKQPIIVTRSMYEVAEDGRSLTIKAEYLKALLNGTHKFMLQVNEMLYPFEVNVIGSKADDDPVTEPVTEPVTDPATDPVTDPVDPSAKGGLGAGIIAIIALLATALLVGAVIVFKKKRKLQ